MVDVAVDTESEHAADRLVAARVETACAAGVAAHGEVLHSVGTHEDLGHQLAARAEQLGLSALVVGSREETQGVTRAIAHDLEDRCVIVA